VLWWSGFTALTGLAWNYLSLLVTRFLFGAGEAGAVPNMFVSVARWFPLIERARAASFVMMSSEVGTALTPLIVIPLQTRFGWRVPFFLPAVMGVVWVAGWRRWYHDHPSDSPRITPRELEEIGHTSTKIQHALPWRSVAHSRNLWIIGFRDHVSKHGG
jgi:MFS transporter, ACS family, glucarate transporter